MAGRGGEAERRARAVVVRTGGVNGWFTLGGARLGKCEVSGLPRPSIATTSPELL